MIHQRHKRTYDMRSQDRALHYSASRGKNILTRLGLRRPDYASSWYSYAVDGNYGFVVVVINGAGNGMYTRYYINYTRRLAGF